MKTELKQKDLEILKIIAEYRILTTHQIAILSDRNKQSLRRKLTLLEKHSFLLTQFHELGRRQGRPERLFSLSEQGIDMLKSRGFLAEKTPREKVLAESISSVDHQLMINWFRIHIGYLRKLLNRIQVQFLSDNSPFLPETESGHSFVTDFAADGASRRTFTPDGVFIITDTAENENLLFFLEVDCGSEPLASPERHIKDVRQKIVNYSSYFDNLGYKRYEEFWNCRLNGFRLLFLTNTLSRLNNLCRLVREMPPSEFIWLAQSQAMFKEGVSGNIWVRGGNVESSHQSILGSLCCQASLPG